MENAINNNEKKYIERLSKKYSEKEITKLDELRELDSKAKRGANIFAYIFGSLGSLVLGFGMCVAMEVILAEFMWLGIVVGVLGILMVSINYLLHKKLMNKGKKKYSAQILELSQELLNE